MDAIGLSATRPVEPESTDGRRAGARRIAARVLGGVGDLRRPQWAALALSLLLAAGLCWNALAVPQGRGTVSADPGGLDRDVSVHPPTLLLGGLAALPMLIGLALGFARLDRATRRAAEAERALERASESRLELERFACTVSHDLKTPLQNMGFLLSYLEEELETGSTEPAPASEMAELVERMQRQVSHMNALIGGVLEYSGGGTGTAEVETIDTRTVLEEIGDALDFAPGQLVLDDFMPTLESWRTPFVQVMSNVVGNARKYHPEPANVVVTVRVARLGECWRFSVADNGAGIDPRHHDRIFELFQTLESGRVAESTGVGLSIVRKCVESVGGAVRVDSSPEGGATFRIDWPMGAVGDVFPAQAA